jgi:hypothetical protein
MSFDNFAASYASPEAYASGIDSSLGAGQSGPLTLSETASLGQADAMADLAQGAQIGGAIMQIGASINQEIVRYYQAKQAQYEAKSKASAMRFQADMANISASMSMEDAASILEAGQQQKAQLTMRAGLEMAQALTRQGARGVKVGAGSAAETQASLALAKEIDAYNIDVNVLRASQAKRTQAVNLRNRGLLGYASAQNVEDSGRRPDQWASLLGGAARVGGATFGAVGGYFRGSNYVAPSTPSYTF